MPDLVDTPAPARPDFKLGRRPFLDGMRCFAVVFVLCFHELLLVPKAHLKFGLGGDAGVDVFFVISGFLITSLLLEERRKTGTVGLGGFYSRRARRLLPALAVLLAAVVVGAIFYASPRGAHKMIESAIATAAYSANWVKAFNINHIGDMHELGHTWSLSVEEQFYLIWPLTLLGLMALGFRRWRLAILLTFASAGAVLWRTEFAKHMHWSFNRTYFGFDTRADGLLMGCTLAVFFHYGLLPNHALIKWVRRALALFGVFCIVVLVKPYHVPWLLHFRFLDTFAITNIATTAIIWALMEEGDSIGAKALSLPPFVFLGQISYGLYLYSFPISFLLIRELHNHVSGKTQVALDVGATLVVATISYFTVERAFRRRRSYLDASPTPTRPSGDQPAAARPSGRRPVLVLAAVVVLLADGAVIALHTTEVRPVAHQTAAPIVLNTPTEPAVSQPTAMVTPPKPGVYLYLNTAAAKGAASFNWAERVASSTIPAPVGVTRLDVRTTTPPGITETVDFSPTAETQVQYAQVGSSIASEVTCDAGPVLLLQLPLTIGSSWVTSTSCTNLLGDTVEDDRRVQVIGPSTQPVAGDSVAVWELVIVAEQTITPQQGGPAHVQATTTTVDISPRYGLIVRQVTQLGSDPSTIHVDHLLAIRPS